MYGVARRAPKQGVKRLPGIVLMRLHIEKQVALGNVNESFKPVSRCQLRYITIRETFVFIHCITPLFCYSHGALRFSPCNSPRERSAPLRWGFFYGLPIRRLAEMVRHVSRTMRSVSRLFAILA